MASELAMSGRRIGVVSYDLFVDLGALAWGVLEIVNHLKKIQCYCGFAATGPRICVALPDEIDSTSVNPGFDVLFGKGPAPLSMALRRAAADGRALFVIVGGLLPANECVATLWEGLQQDPMLGSAQPRFSDAARDLVFALPLPGEARSESALQRGALACLPDVVITAEMSAACTLVRPRIVESVASDDLTGFATASGAFLAALLAARRRGFRNVVVNRAVVALGSHDVAYPAISDGDASRLENWRPDLRKAIDSNRTLAVRALEKAVSGMYSPDGRPRVLLDCRGVAPVHNGTSRCVVGLLDGLAQAAPNWEVNVLTQPPAFQFHALDQRYPAFVHSQGAPKGGFAAALLPNQPWSLATIAELHRHSWAVAFNMLDTIAWDILYPADEHVEPAWRFLAEHADGIAYNSRYTQERVGFRFSVRPGRIERVVHHSLCAEDYSVPSAMNCAEAEHVLLFGNSYDHKDLAPTLALLTDAFPEQSFVVLGGSDIGAAKSKVRSIPSGQIPEEDVHALIATAKCVVYPSFYEGFGLPLVESLSYGRVVLARSSSLWHEIISHSRLPGRVALYESHVELVELLGRHLAGQSIPHLAAGGALRPDEPAVDWAGSARRMIEFIRACIETADATTWLRREFAFRGAGL